MLPRAIADFVARQDTRPCVPARDDLPYSRYYRSIAALLLSGRIRNAAAKNSPNLTDVERTCKEAGFNVQAFVFHAELLIGLYAVTTEGQRYRKGKHFTQFFSQDVAALRRLTKDRFPWLIEARTPARAWRPGTATHSAVYELIHLFCRSFAGLGIRAAYFGATLKAFSELPAESLVRLAHELGHRSLDEMEVGHWTYWLDEPGMAALMQTLTLLGWFAYQAHGKTDYIHTAHAGEVMLGLAEHTAPPVAAADFKVLPSLSVFAGEHLPFETLVPLYRCCRIKHIDRVIEFQLTPQHLAMVPSPTPCAADLHAVLQAAGPLPATVARLLGEEVALQGEVAVRPCRGLIQISDPALLQQIRSTPRLKGYVEPAGPPGYLVIKETSSLETFLERCREFGLTLKPL